MDNWISKKIIKIYYAIHNLEPKYSYKDGKVTPVITSEEAAIIQNNSLRGVVASPLLEAKKKESEVVIHNLRSQFGNYDFWKDVADPLEEIANLQKRIESYQQSKETILVEISHEMDAVAYFNTQIDLNMRKIATLQAAILVKPAIQANS